MNRSNLLRKVCLDGFTLETRDTCRTDSLGKSILAYEFTDPQGEVIFEGEDFACSPLHAIDSDESLRALLGFLTLRPGDTDREYFEDYTPHQLEFCEQHAEYLSLWAMEDGPAFEDNGGEAES